MYLSSRGVKILFILRWIACENCVLIYTNLTFSLSVSLPDSTRKQKRRIPLFNYLTAITMKRRKTAKETQMYRTVFWTLWERTRLDDLGESHWNMYNIIYEMNRQSRFNAWYWMLGAGALRQSRGMVQGGKRERGSGWGTHVYLWQIHVDVW